jgi:hypothetical protein
VIGISATLLSWWAGYYRFKELELNNKTKEKEKIFQIVKN